MTKLFQFHVALGDIDFHGRLFSESIQRAHKIIVMLYGPEIELLQLTELSLTDVVNEIITQ